VQPHLQHLARQYADPARADQSASDLLQEAQLRAWQHLEQFRGAADDGESLLMFRAWIGRIVRHAGLDIRRQTNARRRGPVDGAVVPLSAPGGESSLAGRGALQPPSSESTPSAKLGRKEELQRVLSVLDSMPDPGEREVVRLYFFEELSLAEIAERCSVSHSLVKRRYRAGMEWLQRALKQRPPAP
jgi:RNA polymerase sigma-70 factor (ECF subfamily)